jgi:hypothetical protein
VPISLPQEVLSLLRLNKATSSQPIISGRLQANSFKGDQQVDTMPAYYLTNDDYRRLERTLIELADLVNRIYSQDTPAQQTEDALIILN